MKIFIFAAAALVATTLGAQADEYIAPVSEFPGGIGKIVSAGIAAAEDGKGISGVASSEPGSPAFAPVGGMISVTIEDPGCGGC